MELSDQEAIRQIKNGQIDSFSIIIKRYTFKIHSYIKSKLFNKIEADDLVQNVFISFYKAIYRFDEQKPVSPYLYQIAKNELKMYYRSHKESVSLDEAVNTSDTHKGFEKEDYTDILQNLNMEQKNIFQLLQEGYSYKEIGEKVRRPTNTVRTIIHRTRLLVRKSYYEKP